MLIQIRGLEFVTGDCPTRSRVRIVAKTGAPMVFVGLFAFLLSSSQASAASFFVRAGASGSNNGTSWTNAWNGFSAVSWSSVSCGDTIWVAGGNYTQTLSPTKTCTSASPLAIRRARSDAPEVVSSPGWSSAYDATVHQTGGNAEIDFDGGNNYIIISGRTTAGGGGNGWWLDRTGTTGGWGVGFNASGSNYNTIEYLDLQGPGNINYSSDGRAIDCTPPSGSVTGNTFSHLKIWNWESGIYVVSCSAPTIEYVDMYDIAPLNWSVYHPNGVITWGSPNGIVRYSKFHKGPNGFGVGEGIFFEQSGGSNAWKIYGNVFYDLNSTGQKALEVSASVSDIKIFNNTFDNIILAPGEYGGTCTGASEYRNNLFYATAMGSCGTASNNLTAASANVFVNRAMHDYHIVGTVGAGYPRNAGANLAALFTADMDGDKFGADGAWDVGAYEYTTGGGTTTIAPPQNLTVTVH